MSNSHGGKPRPAPLSVRLNGDELKALRERAGGIPLSTYLKRAVLGGQVAAPNETLPPSRSIHALIAQVLAQLGQAGLADSLRRLARHADEGTLYVDPQTTERLKAACEDVRGMRLLLLKALGKQTLEEEGRAPGALAARFGLNTPPRRTP